MNLIYQSFLQHRDKFILQTTAGIEFIHLSVLSIRNSIALSHVLIMFGVLTSCTELASRLVISIDNILWRVYPGEISAPPIMKAINFQRDRVNQQALV